MGLTADIGAFLAGIGATGTPAAAIPIVCTGMTDCLGVLLAGLDQPATRIAAAGVGARLDHALPLPLARLGVDAPAAALVAGTAAHALDFDDTGLGGHPSAVLLPAILAEAEAVQASGGAMIDAYVAGYEVWAELSGRDADPHHGKGWHPTAVFGTLAAAAASAVLRRLDAARASQALAIAASFAAGLVANFGSMTKPFQVGRAAQSGLLATRLAEAGLTASTDALEHELGFLRAISPHGRVDTGRPCRLGDDWQILRHGLNIKLYPICYGAPRALDGMLDLIGEHAVAAAAIATVEVEIGTTQATMLRNHRPQSATEAKFSVEFAMAAAAIAGGCRPAQLTDDFVQSPMVQTFLERVRVRPNPEQDPEDPVHAPADRVRLTLTDGRRLESLPVARPRGHFRRPLEPAELSKKFADCVADRLRPEQAGPLFERLQRLDRMAGPADLYAFP